MQQASVLTMKPSKELSQSCRKRRVLRWAPRWEGRCLVAGLSQVVRADKGNDAGKHAWMFCIP